MEPKSDQRKFKRVSFKKNVEIYPIFPSYSNLIMEKGKSSLEGMAQDLSSGGISLRTGHHFLAGSLLKLRFENVEKRVVEIFGKIAWSKENSCGITFSVLFSGL